jgi:hypothetical protein
MIYVLFFALYLCLGLAVFAGFRRWHAFLIRLAEQHDVTTRRKIAARYYPLVALLLLAGIGSVLAGSFILILPMIRHDARIQILLPVSLTVAVSPSFVWWFRRWRALTKLGYGRQ